MRTLTAALWLALALLAPTAGFAREAVPNAEDPVVEERMMALASELRCLVCQNQTLAASEASLAEDFRREIRDKIKEGMSDEEIVTFLVDRYGDFVRYRPPLRPATVLLWFGPVLLMGIGLVALVATLRRRRSLAEEPELSAEERKLAEKLLKGKDAT
ncbi:MAG: cytochrome c-type biogenesis protein CcmH [Nitrospirota bacterium]|nr:cytochrome c-type biogenesis protein CcmH [Nitrospirota bacterium]